MTGQILLLFTNKRSLLNDSLTASDSLKFQFATDGEGNYGYLKCDDTFVPFSSTSFEFVESFKNQTATQDATMTLDKGIYMIHAFSSNVSSGKWSY